jgi:hypothetical protein
VVPGRDLRKAAGRGERRERAVPESPRVVLGALDDGGRPRRRERQAEERRETPDRVEVGGGFVGSAPAVVHVGEPEPEGEAVARSGGEDRGGRGGVRSAGDGDEHRVAGDEEPVVQRAACDLHLERHGVPPSA